MKKIITLLLLFLIGITLRAQVEKAVIAEHFTNSVCPICASKNPGLYQNLANHPNVLHIAFHPSSPYPSCIFSMQNPVENDGRTNFYGIYGGTPRLVINGEVQSVSVNFSNPSLFDPYSGQTSPISIIVKENRFNAENFQVEVKIKTVSMNTREQALLFLGFVEDTVFYTSPNGESTHTDIFRKALTNVDGDMITLPAMGDSLTLYYNVIPDALWNINRMYTMAILQDPTSKMLIQAARTSGIDYTNPNSVIDLSSPKSSLQIYPNPAINKVNIDNAKEDIYLISSDGRTLLKVAALKGQKTTIDISGIPEGIYILRSGTKSSVLSLVR